MIKISVITATWNCVSTVADCLDSVAGQTYGEREHVVIDGASRDGTIELLQSRREQFSVLASEPDRGIYDALNKGIARASGDVVGFLHADDVYENPHVLARIAKVFNADPTVCAVYGDLHYVQKEDTTRVVRHWKSSNFAPRKLAWGWMPPHPTLYVRRGWYERIGGFDTRYRISADYFSILQMFCKPDFKSAYLPEVLVKMRLGGASNKSLKSVLRKSREDWDALRRAHMSRLESLGALTWKNLSKIKQFQ